MVVIPMAIKITFNYMFITYGYVNIRRLDKDHSTQNEKVTPVIYKSL